MENIHVHPLSELPEDIYYDFQGYSNLSYYKQKSLTPTLDIKPFPFRDYYHAFEKMQGEIQYGNTFLINLTARHEILTDLTLSEIYHVSAAKYKLFYRDTFTCFSPETFVTIQDNVIKSCPMKGTIKASIPNAKETLFNDIKETAEHHTIVDLIRNDLSRHATKVHVSRFKYLDKIKTQKGDLYQMSTEIKGQLTKDYHNHLGDILFSMLPAGSISGAPKPKTLEIIKNNESHPRGYYTGIAGIYDGQNFDSCVLIRYIAQEDNKLYYHSGGGITFQSHVEKEYLEMLDKIYIPTS